MPTIFDAIKLCQDAPDMFGIISVARYHDNLRQKINFFSGKYSRNARAQLTIFRFQNKKVRLPIGYLPQPPHHRTSGSAYGGSMKLPGRSRVMNFHPQFFDRYKTLILQPLVGHTRLGGKPSHPARGNDFLDCETINKLCEQNGDVAKFVEDVKIDFKSKRIHTSEYDEIPKDPENTSLRNLVSSKLAEQIQFVMR